MKKLLYILPLMALFSFMWKKGGEKTSIHQFKANTIDGKVLDFSTLKGKKILIVNTASECGFTPQYKQLEEIYEKYKGQNFEIIGFPANNFGSQEPGSNADIKTFCQKNYGVSFTMMEKVSVKGDDMCEIYRWLTDKSKNGVSSSSVKWNFQKYMIDENGFLVDSVAPWKKPDCDKIVKWIEGKNKFFIEAISKIGSTIFEMAFRFFNTAYDFMKVDILAIGVHPDDVELGCSGTLLKHIALGKTAGILDLTLGELGTRGNAELRTQEAQKAAKILGVAFREQLTMADGFFENNRTHQIDIIRVLREHRPEIVMCNAISDRHPDHGRASKLTVDACFYSGLSKIETLSKDGKAQAPWRPKAVYHYIQDHFIQPDVVVDITEFFDKKMEAIYAFSSQFYDPQSKEPETPISSPEFMENVQAKAIIYGRAIGARYAEGFTVDRYIGVDNLFHLR